MLDDTGEPPAALAEFHKALAIAEKVYPSDSAEIARVLISVGVVEGELGRNEDALAADQRALSIFALHPDDVQADMSTAYLDIGATYLGLERYKEAADAFTHALVLARATYGDASSEAAVAVDHLGIAVEQLGDPARAKQLMEQGLATRIKALGPEHPDVAESLANLSENANVRHDHAAAIAFSARGIALLDHSQSPDSNARAAIVHERVVAEIGLGRAAEALADATALRDHQLAIHRPVEASVTRILVADALWAQGGAEHHAAATKEAKAALDELTAAKDVDPEALRRAREWPARHGGQ